MMVFKYKSAHEWLIDFINIEDDLGKLQQIARQIAETLDSDAIQELFEREMDMDGFFDEEEAT